MPTADTQTRHSLANVQLELISKFEECCDEQEVAVFLQFLILKNLDQTKKIHRLLSNVCYDLSRKTKVCFELLQSLRSCDNSVRRYIVQRTMQRTFYDKDKSKLCTVS
jgi:uncharacterized membrane-anchored protein YjiN (DUF445 family)